MDSKTVFVLTRKGEGEIKNHTRRLPEDVKRALLLVDDESTVEILARRVAPGLRDELGGMLRELETGGFIRDKASLDADDIPKMTTPATLSRSAERTEHLDFTRDVSAPPDAARARKAGGSATRSMIATVLFFDVVAYTKQPVSKQLELKAQFNKLVSEFIGDIAENQRIILDTGDGAAIGFLQHPEDAIEVALKFHHAVTADKHRDYPDLRVRIGIHLGPVTIVKDMNGQSNMVGDGINDAQRIMSFAPPDRIYISRACYDVVSRLSAEYASLFQYRGVQNDKHGHQHQIYEASVEQGAGSGPTEGSGQPEEQQKPASFSIQLEPFYLNGLGQAATPASKPLPDGHARPPLSISPPEGERDSVALREFHVDAAKIPAAAAQTSIVQEQVEAAAQQEIVPQKAAQKTEAEAQASAAQKAREEAEAERLKAEQEAAKVKAEQDARLMAEEQAKAWAEAEQRARAEHAAKQAAQDKTSPAPPSAHARRKPLPLGKIAAALFVLLLALAAALPYVWPMQGLVAQLEKELSAQLQQPVHIAHMKAAWLPLPSMELQDVSVGDARQLQAASVTLNFDMTSLFSGTSKINNVALNDLALNPGSFGQTLFWLQAAGGNARYPVAHMTFKHARISGEELGLPPVDGDAAWDAQGHFSKVLLHSEDGKLDVQLQARQQRWQIALHIKESGLPWLPGIPFDELDAKGEIGEDAADFSEIDGHLYGGKLTGSARLNWQNGWRLRGRLNVGAMELQQAMPQLGMEGEMEGEGSFLLNAATLPQLSATPHLDGTFAVKKGVIGKVDLVEIAANHQGASGGRTHFDKLTGALQLENDNLHLRQLSISSGAMSAYGSMDIGPGGRLSGRLSVDLKMRPGSAQLALSGTLAEPVLRPAP